MTALWTGHLWQFPVEFRASVEQIVIRICHSNKELYDRQLQITSEGSLHKDVKWRWVSYKPPANSNLRSVLHWQGIQATP